MPAAPQVQMWLGEVELGLVLDGRAMPDHNATSGDCY